MFDLLLKDITAIASDAAKAVLAEDFGGRTPDKVKGILVVREEDRYLSDFLMGLLNLSECRIVKAGETFYSKVCNIRKPRRCRVVIAVTEVNLDNQKDIGDAVNALSIKSVVKKVSVFAFEDKRPRFKVIMPGG